MTINSFNLQQIHQSQTPPPLFERGAPMWNDPYIATQMLTFHLDETHGIASRRPEIIDETVAWITNTLNLQAGMHLLDLGCGPGLYTKRFAENGLQITGVDYSQNSIDYAKLRDSATTYLCQNYNDMNFANNTFDVVMMIFGDFCVLNNEERDNLLAKVHKMLKIGGHFVFDVSQPQHHQYLNNHNQWSIEPDGGFWMPDPYLVLEQGFIYHDNISAHQYIVIQSDGTQTLYRNWYHDYTATTIAPVVTAQGFELVATYADLIGTPYSADSEWCGVIAQRRAIIS